MVLTQLVSEDTCVFKPRSALTESSTDQTPVVCTDFLKGRGEKKGTLARVLAPKRAP